MKIQRDIFPLRGGESMSKPQYALPVINQVASQFQSAKVATAGTDFAVAAGAAGAALTIKLPFAPILGNFGRTGNFGNSSLTFGAGLATTLATEVAFIANSASNGGDVTSLSNGQYMVDYEAGVVYGKRADTGTTGTATYSYWLAGSVAGTGALATEVQCKAPSGSPAVGNPVQTGGVYNLTPITLNDGDVAAFQLDVNGNLKQVAATMPGAEDNTSNVYQTVRKYLATITYQGTKFQNNSFQTFNVKNTAGTLTHLAVTNTTASVRYAQVHNTSATPSASATAFLTFQVPANSSIVLDADLLGQNGANLTNGIALANSSAAAIYTAGTAGDLLVNGWFM